MESVLNDILAAKREAVEKAQQATPLKELRARVREAPRPQDFKAALMAEGLSIIGEVKRSSPSRGTINEQVDVAQLAKKYQQGGAAAISVLTEEKFFSGRPDDLMRIKETVSLPVLRKDFIFAPYQLWESRAMGADAVLLLTSILDLVSLRRLILLARELELTPLVEVHQRSELDRAIEAGADVVGVNARDLKTFVVDLRTPLSLAPIIPPGITTVAESGITSQEDALRMRRAGYDAVLVGETLMRAEDAGQTVRQLACE